MGQDTRERLAHSVNTLRVEKGLSREGLSLELGLDNSYISKLEKSKVNITLDTLEHIARYFNKDIAELLAKREKH